MSEAPFYGSFEQPDESKKSEVAINRQKATFQWPPDCMWPFLDHGAETET